MFWCKKDRHMQLVELIKNLQKDNKLLSKHVKILISENERLNKNLNELSMLLSEYINNK